MDNKPINVLAIDPSVAGISGDMFISALSGLFDGYMEYIEILQQLLLQKYNTNITITVENVNSQGFKGNRLEIEGNRTKVEDVLGAYDELIEHFNLSQKYIDFGRSMILDLLEAEQEVHNSDPIHLHELGTVDTLIDTILPSVFLHHLKISKIQISPIATGKGTIETEHGVLPVPSPATDYLIRKSQIPTVIGPVGEATTPTGIAVIYNLKKHFLLSNQVTWLNSSLGYGKKQWNDRPNLLRVRLGEQVSEYSTIKVLETHLDDVSGEILGYTLNKLMDTGALDVSYYPLFMKKGRPGYCLRVICDDNLVDDLSKIMMENTGTLGIRVQNVNRHIGKREIKLHELTLEGYDKHIKTRVKHGEYHSKIEFDDIIELANNTGLNPKQLHNKIMKLIDEENNHES